MIFGETVTFHVTGSPDMPLHSNVIEQFSSGS